MELGKKLRTRVLETICKIIITKKKQTLILGEFLKSGSRK